jgi:isopentenyl-diphosphate delta-isomerase
MINLEEVAAWKWMNLDAVAKALEENPEEFTVWFKIIFDRFYTHINTL